MRSARAYPPDRRSCSASPCPPPRRTSAARRAAFAGRAGRPARRRRHRRPARGAADRRALHADPRRRRHRRRQHRARSAGRSRRSSPPTSGIRSCSRRSARPASTPPSFPQVTAPDYGYFATTGAQNLVQGFVQANPDGRLTVGCYLYDIAARTELARQGYVVQPARLAPRRAPLRRRDLSRA